MFFQLVLLMVFFFFIAGITIIVIVFLEKSIDNSEHLPSISHFLHSFKRQEETKIHCKQINTNTLSSFPVCCAYWLLGEVCWVTHKGILKIKMSTCIGADEIYLCNHRNSIEIRVCKKPKIGTRFQTIFNLNSVLKEKQLFQE